MKFIICISLLLVTLLAGCVNLKPKPDKTQVFALAANVEAVADISGPECYISRVELPGYLEGKRIYYRSGSGELNSIAGSRWAEAPIEALPRAIAMHLQATGKAKVRAYYPWAKTERDATTISVQFERLSANAAGEVEVVAQWQVRSANDAVKEGRFLASALIWDGNDAADYVSKLDIALSELATVIAQEL